MAEALPLRVLLTVLWAVVAVKPVAILLLQNLTSPKAPPSRMKAGCLAAMQGPLAQRMLLLEFSSSWPGLLVMKVWVRRLMRKLLAMLFEQL